MHKRHAHRKSAYQFDIREAMRKRPIERLLLNHKISDVVKFLGLVGLTCAVYPRFIAPYRLKIVQRAMPFRNLPREFHGYKILHIADLHVGGTRTAYLRSAINAGLAHKPDLILISGDLIDYRRKALTEIKNVLPLLKAPDGVVTIFGNHDYHEFSWRHIGERSAHRSIHKRLVRYVENTGIVLLRNQSHLVRRGNAALQIVGLDEMWVGHMDPVKAFQNVDPAAPTIVLQHNPDGFPALQPYSWEWMLCGHTHGGQVDVPILGPLYVPMVNIQWLRGFFDFKDDAGRARTMYVSTGVGHTLPHANACPAGNSDLYAFERTMNAMVINSIITWESALGRITARAQQVDQNGSWPAENLADLQSCGALAWAIPQADGGAGLDPVELQKRYAQLAGACLTTTLILTQRDAAIGFLLGAGRTELVARMLREMANGSTFATIGIAQLTTSRQHLPPAVMGMRVPDGYRITGTIPWVTSAPHTNWIIAGAALQSDYDGKPQQILFALRVPQDHVEIKPPMRFPALTGSLTAEVVLRDVFVPDVEILSGPTENALAGREAVRSFALPTCILPLGLAAGALDMATQLILHRNPEIQAPIRALQSEHDKLAHEVYKVGMTPGNYPMAELSPKLRADANMLAARCTLAALELAKGHGFLLESPAQRRAREALFFFVWSSPQAVVEQTLIRLAKS